MKIHFLPTVWSDCILLESRGHFGLVDAGFDFGGLSGCFSRLKVEKLDFIILTHFHCDHYGAIKETVENYPVEKVIFKDFSGVVSRRSDGKPADDSYRESEKRICAEIKKAIGENSKLVLSDEVKTVMLGGIELRLFNTGNVMKEIFFDEKSKCYGKFVSGENNNNMPVFFSYAGRNVLLSGDMTDGDAEDERISFMNSRLAERLSCKIDIYKAPHHGYGIGSEKTVMIYKPEYTVITNTEENTRDAVMLLRSVNPGMSIYHTSNGGKVFEIADNGKITVSDLAL